MKGVRLRLVAGAIVCAALAAVFIRACFSLPHYGESRGPFIRHQAIEAVRASHATSMDAFINFDLRGFDTLGEEFIFLVAIGGFTLILREDRAEKTDRLLPPAPGRAPQEADIVVKIATLAYVPIAIAYGLYIIIHGQLTPGGGFQGGVALATGALAVALGVGFPAFVAFAPKEPVEAFEAIGSLAYVVVGFATLIASGIFLRNALPHGDTGALLSSGTILVLNDAVGIAVVGGFLVLFAEFLLEMQAEA